MSNDLSNQLRSLNTFEWMARPATTKQICFDAADRIEKLETALREITTKDLFGMDWAIRTARRALEPQSYRGQQDDSALKAERPTALSAEDIRKMNHE